MDPRDFEAAANYADEYWCAELGIVPQTIPPLSTLANMTDDLAECMQLVGQQQMISLSLLLWAPFHRVCVRVCVCSFTEAVSCLNMRSPS